MPPALALSQLLPRGRAAVRGVTAALLLAGVVSAAGAATIDALPGTTSAAMIESVVIRLRDDAAATDATTMPSREMSRIANQLRTGLVESGRTRDGAFKLTFSPALSVEAARAAINRVRMLPDVVYADMVSSATTPLRKTKAATEGRRTHRLIVKYKDPTITYRALRNLPLDTAQLDQLGVAARQPVAHERTMGGGEYLLRVLKALPRDELQASADRIAALPGVEYAIVDDLKFPTAVPNDPQYANQWHYKSPPAEAGGVNLPPAWDLTTGSASVFIAVMDTGILPHPDLAGRVTTGYDMIDDNLVANDGDYRDPDPFDSGDWITSAEASLAGGWFEGCYLSNSSWHGTHVAGTIAAASNNGLGVAGVNWVSKIVPVRVLGKCGGYTSDIVDGMRWATGISVPGVPVNQNPAKVLNLSLGGSGPCSNFEQTAINAMIAAGSTIVIAAGNDNENASDHSPGNCNGVITVAATGRAGQRAQYSNFGSIVEIAAPGGADGDYILSTLNTGSTLANPTGYYYEYYGGTSMATPHVAGIVSLMLSVNPTMTPAQVLSTIQTTARAFPSNTIRNCTTSICGAGIIDAYAAVLSAKGGGPVPPGGSSTTLASSANPSNSGANVTFTATVVGTNPTGNVAFAVSSTAITGCSAVALTGTGNTRTAACTTNTLAVGVHSIVANYVGDAGNTASANAPLSQVVNAAPAVQSAPLHRFNTGTYHFYTISEAEKAYVIATFPTWKYEGISYYAFPAAAPNTLPVYRFNTGSNHFYTISEAEKNYVLATFPAWILEGKAYWTYPSSQAATSPVYRFNTGTYHFYTISAAEKAYVQATFPSWVFEGIGYYARTSP